MSERIKQWIGFFFDGLPYSEEAVNAREKIEEAMLERVADASPEELAERYGSYEKLAGLAGYNAEQVKTWRSTEALPDSDDVKWVQEYRDDSSALLFTMAQFGRYLEIEELLKKRLANVEEVGKRIAGKEA